MSDEIPQWAWAEVAKIDRRHPAPKNKGEWARYADELRTALAGRIAEHEEPPVDPLLIEAREIAISTSYEGEAEWSEGWREKTRAGRYDNEDRVRVALAALRRGIELAQPPQDAPEGAGQ